MLGAGDKSTSIFLGIIYFIGYVVIFIFIIYVIILVFSSVRKVPMQGTGSGMATRSDQVSYFPIKVNPSGVLPVIFASLIF